MLAVVVPRKGGVQTVRLICPGLVQSKARPGRLFADKGGNIIYIGKVALLHSAVVTGLLGDHIIPFIGA